MGGGEKCDSHRLHRCATTATSHHAAEMESGRSSSRSAGDPPLPAIRQSADLPASGGGGEQGSAK